MTMTTQAIDNIHSVEDIMIANKNVKQFFFSPATMRFFKSRVLDGIYKIPSEDLVLFVTSEKGLTDVREYCVRSFDVHTSYCDALIDHRYSTAREAKRDAKKMSKNDSTSLDNL